MKCLLRLTVPWLVVMSWRSEWWLWRDTVCGQWRYSPCRRSPACSAWRGSSYCTLCNRFHWKCQTVQALKATKPEYLPDLILILIPLPASLFYNLLSMRSRKTPPIPPQFSLTLPFFPSWFQNVMEIWGDGSCVGKTIHILKIKSTWTNLRPDSLGDKNVVHVDVKFCALFTQSAPFGNFVGYRIMPVSTYFVKKSARSREKGMTAGLLFRSVLYAL